MNRPPKFLVYKSSAGSGKTFSLAKVFLSLVLKESEDAYFRRILALTFTVKAAAEMKDRIITYLSLLAGHSTRTRSDLPFMEAALIEETGLSRGEIQEKSKSILRTILHEYGDFHVITIDKFFARMIKTFASDLALAPDFDIQIDHGQFIDQVKELLYEKVGNDEALTKLVLKMVKSRLAEDKSDNADDIIQRACHTLLGDDFHFIEDEFKVIEPEQVFKVKESLDRDIKVLMEQVTSPGKEVVDAISSAGLEPGDLYNNVYSHFERYANEDFWDRPRLNDRAQKALAEGRWQSGKKNPGVLSLIPLLERCHAQIESQLHILPKLKLLLAVQKQLFALGFFGELRQLMEVIKAEENIRLLSEFNTIISDKLKNEQTFFLFERLGARYHHVLIDEFQDTSTLQWHNLLPLVENSLSEGHTALIVGDAKQSIYRFRNSEPEQFVKLPEVAHASQELFEQAYQEVVLGENYRSSPQVVEFNNRFFQEIKSSLLGEEHQRTYDTLIQHPARTTQGSVRWWIMPSDNEKKEDVTMAMLEQVKLRIDEGTPSGDICCLFKKNDDAANFASLLLQSGIDVVSQESLLLKNNPFVGLVVDTLKAIIVPKDPFILQHWLSRLHQSRGLENYHKLALTTKKDKLDLYDLAAKCNVILTDPDIKFGDSFTRSLAIVNALGIPTEHPFISKFLDIALHFESTSQYLNTTFLDYWAKKSEKASIQLAGNKNAVSIMTIHKSKGLEFPHVMVYLPEFNTKNLTKSTVWVDISEPINLGQVPLNRKDLKDSILVQLHEEEQEKTALDALNELYVAFTRAEASLEIFSKQPSRNHAFLCIKQWPEWDESDSVLKIG